MQAPIFRRVHPSLTQRIQNPIIVVDSRQVDSQYVHSAELYTLDPEASRPSTRKPDPEPLNFCFNFETVQTKVAC